MSLLNTLQGYMPFLNRRQSPLPREDMLALKPVRNRAVTWEPLLSGADDEAEESAPGPGGVVLVVPRRDDRWGRLLARWLQVPTGKKIELDEFGGEVWTLCDGSRTVEELVKHTCEKYKLNRRQGEISVVAFMRMLAQRRLVGFISGGKGATHGRTEPVGRAKPKRSRRTVAARRRH